MALSKFYFMIQSRKIYEKPCIKFKFAFMLTYKQKYYQHKLKIKWEIQNVYK